MPKFPWRMPARVRNCRHRRVFAGIPAVFRTIHMILINWRGQNRVYDPHLNGGVAHAGRGGTMRLTIRTNLAMRVLMTCAVNPGYSITKAEIADKCNASKNHLGQVIRQLAHLGYIKALRGRNGGMYLARTPEDLRSAEQSLGRLAE